MTIRYVLTGAEATASMVRVLIESTDGELSGTRWGGYRCGGCQLGALCDSFEYTLLRKDRKLMSMTMTQKSLPPM